jgi:hypothetical protein
MSNPVDALNELYAQQLKENDAEGFSEVYKTCIEDIIASLQKNFNIVDLKLLDGYYMFAKGSNSIAHFHITECPGWLFGIWLDHEITNVATDSYIKFAFFTQYEKTIDKFKPSASTLKVEGQLDFTKSMYPGQLYDCEKLITYIKNEPELAFCRDEFYYDYNVEYLSREQAKSIVNKFFKDENHTEEVVDKLDRCLLQYYETNIFPLFAGSSIVDKGENHYPRYALTAPMSKLEVSVNVAGYYALSAICKHNEGTIAELDKYITKLKAEADNEDVTWYPCIDEVVFVYDDSEE